ncbi:hypothetical protein MHBO_004974, partial [Bonamia ostreae]
GFIDLQQLANVKEESVYTENLSIYGTNLLNNKLGKIFFDNLETYAEQTSLTFTKHTQTSQKNVMPPGSNWPFISQNRFDNLGFVAVTDHDGRFINPFYQSRYDEEINKSALIEITTTVLKSILKTLFPKDEDVKNIKVTLRTVV